MDTQALETLRGRTVLVTGGGGSIGAELCTQLLDVVRELRIVSHSEQPLYDVGQRLARAGTRPWTPPWITYLASVDNYRAMLDACEGVDVVFHAAAHKHVPMCERFPLEAIRNNFGGTVTLYAAARHRKVKTFVYVSTDKAVKPASIMGMTKRAAELFLLRARLAFQDGPALRIVRFGNVLDSAGSVLPLWRKQIAEGGPITLTDKRCTRFFMSIPDAVQLLMCAAVEPRDGVYILDMGPQLSLYGLASKMQQEAYLGRGLRVEIVETGLRPGEKLTEELTVSGERLPTAVLRVYFVNEPFSRDHAGTEALHCAITAGLEDEAVRFLREYVK